MSGNENRAALRWLFGLLLLGVVAWSGGVAVFLVGVLRRGQSSSNLLHFALQAVSWLYLGAGVTLAVALLLERHGTRLLFSVWLASLILLLATLPHLLGSFGVIGGVICAVLVWGLVSATEWATRRTLSN